MYFLVPIFSGLEPVLARGNDSARDLTPALVGEEFQSPSLEFGGLTCEIAFAIIHAYSRLEDVLCVSAVELITK
jgi:hypothetical protein